jgi:uncharacterized protein
MRLEHSFEVPVPAAQAWTVLLDIERIAPCMPGATLTSFDGDTFTGVVKVKLGPVSLTYQGSGRFVERDEAARRVELTASGQDARGAGAASARITATLSEPGDGSAVTMVSVVADLDIAGRVAQFGRGMIADVSAKLIAQFADCLARTLAASSIAAGSEPTEHVVPGAPAAAVAAPLPSAPLPSAPWPAPLPAEATQTQPARAASSPAVPPAAREAAPIDLLAVSGVKGAARQYAPYLILAALLVLLLVLLVVM